MRSYEIYQNESKKPCGEIWNTTRTLEEAVAVFKKDLRFHATSFYTIVCEENGAKVTTTLLF